MFWGCVNNEGIETFTEVGGDIKYQKYMNIMDTNLRPVIMRHCPNEDYVSSDINIIENVWGTIKKSSNVQTIQNRPHHEPEMFLFIFVHCLLFKLVIIFYHTVHDK